ncbi:MAG TPA: DNA cytosine methyltransferase [Syntrophomonadaceae bacterium]|nr:DNA cytosine methyltransferase [Syntrophomonadaceae bacterium]
MVFTAVDLFAGAGGFSLGFSKLGFEVLLANDNWKAAAKTYKANHPETEFIFKDIEDLEVKEILDKTSKSRGEIDLIIGGPPCQGFSTVGKRFIDDPRNRLFKEYVRIVEGVYPKVFVMENVVGLTNMQKGKVLEQILSQFQSLGYKVQFKILNALDYGVPQIRERVVLIGTRYDIGIEFPEPIIGESNLFSKTQSRLTVMDAISDLPPVQAGETVEEYTIAPLNEYQEARRKDCEKITLHSAVSHNSKLLEMMDYIPDGGSIWNVEDLPEHLRPTSGYKNTYSRLDSREPGMTITRNFSCVSSSRCIHPLQNRGLTAREAARIQSFDDDYVFLGNKSDISLQIGNAVPPLLSEKIAESVQKMLEVIESKYFTPTMGTDPAAGWERKRHLKEATYSGTKNRFLPQSTHQIQDLAGK